MMGLVVLHVVHQDSTVILIHVAPATLGRVAPDNKWGVQAVGEQEKRDK
jgi:hypothetical protein